MAWARRLTGWRAGAGQPAQARASSRPLILIFNTCWVPIPETLNGCPGGCEITTDPFRFDEADAVVFHVPTLRRLPSVPKRSGQFWVALSMESDVNYPRLADPDYMRPIDLTMTYRLDSDIPTPYLRDRLLEDLLRPPREKAEPAPAVFIASNANDHSGRADYVRELMRYIAVDSYGRVLQNRTLAADRGRPTKLDTIGRYKFTLAFENSISRDYVTEKFFDPLVAGSVPVYLGAPNVADFAPAQRSFINVADFGSPRELADYLTQLDQDDGRYREYLAWKERGLREQFTALVERYRVDPFCRLCQRILQNR